jgi:hypothetical protein
MIMKKSEFVFFRKTLNKTQVQMAQLLGVSLKAIHSYEQGWRTIPTHVERQAFFLMSKKIAATGKKKQCWVTNKCPNERRSHCPAWEFQTGELCWFINGTICEGCAHKKWKDKILVCRSCNFFISIFGEVINDNTIVI